MISLFVEIVQGHEKNQRIQSGLTDVHDTHLIMKSSNFQLVLVFIKFADQLVKLLANRRYIETIRHKTQNLH
jgi:hypothetical protein